MILDFVDGSLGSPVNGGREVTGGKLGDRLVLDSLVLTEVSLELVLSHGRELVVVNLVEVLWIRVDLLELGISLGKLVKSEGVFLISSIGESEGGNMLDELLFDSEVSI